VQRRSFDEFQSISFDEKARLDNFAIQLQNDPGAQGYMIVYGGRTSRLEQADRLIARGRDCLMSQRGIDASRLISINGGFREQDYFELWIVPQGAEPPQPRPTVNPSQVRPAPAPPARRRHR
jgi:hypothetical protein